MGRIVGMPQTGQAPKIAILMATYNGGSHLQAQVESVLAQERVDVRLFIADDGSSDGTAEYVATLAARDPRVTLVTAGSGGSAPKNFLRLATESRLGDAQAVGFVDQDDIWFANKLETQWELLQQSEAVSSDVLAMFPDRDPVPLIKSQPQRQFDYLFESAGPGCTFLLRRDAFDRITDAVRAHPLLPEVAAHDWLFYAVARVLGISWHIDDEPTMMYRQHDENVTGANMGLTPRVKRFKQLTNGEFREQCTVTAQIALDVAPDDFADVQELAEISTALKARGRKANLVLARHSKQFRRRARDRIILRSLIATGAF